MSELSRGRRAGSAVSKLFVLDLRILRPAWVVLTVFLAVATLALCVGNTTMVSFVAVIPVVAILNLLGSIEQGKLTQLLGALPGRRADVMRAHYLVALVFGALTIVPFLIALLVHRLWPSYGVDAGALLDWLAGLGGVLVAVAFMIPSVVKWGSGRGALVLMFVTVLAIVGGVAVKGLGASAADNTVPGELGGGWPLAPLGVGLVALAISLSIATRIYERQDH